MKKRLSYAAFLSAMLILISILFTMFLSGCDKSLDDVYVVPEPTSEPETKGSDVERDTTAVDSLSVREWISVDAGTVVF